MSGTAAQRGFIYQTIITMVECLERDDWEKIKLEPKTGNDKVDILLFKNSRVLKAIQVKSSQNKFSQPEVEKWLKNVKADVPYAEEVALYLVGDSYTSNCEEYIKSTPEIETYPFSSLEIICRLKLQEYIVREGHANQIDEDDLRVAYNNLFSEIHNNSISPNSFDRTAFEGWLLRVLSLPKCLTDIPSINRNVGLIGRERELREVREMLDNDGCLVLISGLGGIGKTSVMRWICNAIKEDGNAKNHVAWINCGLSLQEDLLLLRESLGVEEGGTNTENYKRIIHKLRNFKGILYLFMDNMSRIPDAEEMKILNSLQPNVHIMITARHRIEDIPYIYLETLEPECALNMFYKYYERDLERRYECNVQNIVDMVQRHTLLVELLARAAGKSGGTLENFNEELVRKGFFDVFRRPLNTKHDEYLTIEDCIIRLYEISRLTECQKHALRLFSIFTPEKEIYWKVTEWAELDMEAVDELVDRAWLSRGGLENGLFIHQIVKDSLAKQFGNQLRLEDYNGLIQKVVDTYSYMPLELDYRRIKERLVLAEDIARYLEQCPENHMILDVSDDLEQNVDNLQTRIELFLNIGYVQFNQGSYESALEYYSKALSIQKRAFTEDGILVGKTYNFMALAYLEQGKYDEAWKFCKASIDISEQYLGPEHLEIASLYNNLGDICSCRDDLKEAERCYVKALTIAGKSFGPADPTLAAFYNNIASLYLKQEEYQKAIVFYKKAIHILAAEPNPCYPLLAKTYNNMAIVYSKQGDYRKAKKLFEKTLCIRNKVLGPQHPDVAVTYHTMANMYSNQKKYTQALECLNKACAIREYVLGVESSLTISTYNNIAWVYAKQRNYKKALEYYNKIITVKGHGCSDEDTDIASTYNNIATVYCYQGDFKNAIFYHEQAYMIMSRKLGENHPNTIALRHDIENLKVIIKNGEGGININS